MNEHSQQDNPTRKEREKRARQQEILKAARELFVTKGFRETTLDEIAHQAEFGKGTLYNYFANKEEIFRAIVEQAVEDSLAIGRESSEAAGGIREGLAVFAQKTIRYIKENGELLHVIYHELHRNPNPDEAWIRTTVARANEIWEPLAALLRREMDKGAIRKCDPIEYVVLFDGMVRGYCFKKFSLDGMVSDEDYTRTANLIVSVFLDGITERT
jgi:TetR/AcrR family transcriptional regulator, repressor of fatR-cypB operon